jgi:hypothetical protein
MATAHVKSVARGGHRASTAGTRKRATACLYNGDIGVSGMICVHTAMSLLAVKTGAKVWSHVPPGR